MIVWDCVGEDLGARVREWGSVGTRGREMGKEKEKRRNAKDFSFVYPAAYRAYLIKEIELKEKLVAIGKSTRETIYWGGAGDITGSNI